MNQKGQKKSGKYWKIQQQQKKQKSKKINIQTQKKIIQNGQKNQKFQQISKNLYKNKTKMAEQMLSYKFSNIRRTEFDQSSPVQTVAESWVGPLSMTEDGGWGNPWV